MASLNLHQSTYTLHLQVISLVFYNTPSTARKTIHQYYDFTACVDVRAASRSSYWHSNSNMEKKIELHEVKIAKSPDYTRRNYL